VEFEWVRDLAAARGGLVLLIAGGELLVPGAVQVATGLGVSPLVIGLTLVGFGTSTPELVTSVQAALTDAPGIAYGNIVGSNIANILLIVGVAALISPMVIASMALKRDGSVMLAVAVVFSAAAFSMPLGRVVGTRYSSPG
jgi:cation:H+ antiporter